MTQPVCIDENLTTDDTGLLRMQPWAVPRLVVDVLGLSTGDGVMLEQTAMPGKMMIELAVNWINETPVEHMVLIRVVRRYRKIIVSNPNAIQFRDRWTWAIDAPPDEPVTTSIFNSQVGYAGDLGTDSFGEPNPGVFWYWAPTTMDEEWVGPVAPNSNLDVWYRQYVWTPPPWSNNANKNTPLHEAEAGWSRLSLMVFPAQGSLVTG